MDENEDELPEMKEVFSTSVGSLGWRDGLMFVQWAKGGRISQYLEVPEDVFERVVKSWSIGTAIREDVKPYYHHRYIV